MYEYQIRRVALRTRPVEELNEMAVHGYRVIATFLHNADMVCLLEREVSKPEVKKAEPKKATKQDDTPAPETQE